MTKSQTIESLSELNPQQPQLLHQHQPKNGSPPSLLSSGYESQAVSLTTLSSEDSLSIRSMSVEDENQDAESDIGRLSDLTTDLSLHHRHTNNRSSLIEEEGGRSPRVVLRRNSSLRNWNKQTNRLSCPSSLISMDYHHHHNSSSSRPSKQRTDNNRQNGQSSTEGINIINNNCSRGDEVDDDDDEAASAERQISTVSTPPDWLVVGESVQVRPSNLSGVVRYVGSTQFAPGLWVGVELDTSRGKNDGCVDGVRYFSCAARQGMFVRPKSLKLDRRGREMRVARVAAAQVAAAPLRSVVRTKSRQGLNQNPCGKTSGLS